MIARTVIRPGSLRHVVAIQQPVETPNEFGERELSWSDVQTNWRASVEPLSGRELMASSQVQADVTHRVRLRWFGGLTPRMRIVWGQRVLQIQSAINLEERDVQWECLCREVA